jgi:NAD(P)-dependent dehydrogenase (short-subunit alcohol dehydrogenase family)
MGQDKRVTNDTKRTVVITGGNSGLGYETAAGVLDLRSDWHVVLASHNKKRIVDAAERLERRTGNPAVTPMTLNLGSTEAVHAFTDTLRGELREGRLPPLQAVICNAGIQNVTGTAYTDDGFEATLGVNHLGHFLLVNRLLDQITPPARFVFLAGAGTESDAERQPGFWALERVTGVVSPRTDFENLREMVYPEGDSSENPQQIGMRRYTTSKLANVLTAFELDRRLREQEITTPGAPVTSIAFNPGLLPGTGLARDRSAVEQFVWNRVMPALRLLPSVSSVGQRGRDLARLATDSALTGVSGVYFKGRTIAVPHPAARNEELARTLWKESAELVGLEGPELRISATRTG